MLYYEKPKAFHKLKHHLAKYYFKNEPEKAEMLTVNIRYECLDDLSKEKFTNLMAYHDIVPENQKQVSELINLVTELSNHTRRWEHNGHTPKELEEMGIPTPKPLAPSLIDKIKNLLSRVKK